MGFLKLLFKTFIVVLIVSCTLKSLAQTPVNFSVVVPSALVVDAGPDTAIYYGTRISLGASPAITGGTAPYTILWSPSIGLSDISLANPWAYPTVNTQYTVMVEDKNGCSGSDKIYVKSRINSGIGNTATEISFSIYPNPNKGLFNLSLDGDFEDLILTLTIVNSVGKTIYTDYILKTYGKYERTIDMSNESKGMYIVKLSGDNTTIVKKLFVE